MIVCEFDCMIGGEAWTKTIVFKPSIVCVCLFVRSVSVCFAFHFSAVARKQFEIKSGYLSLATIATSSRECLSVNVCVCV